jgi:hypothetical protein
VSRFAVPGLFLALLVAACGSGMQTKEQVRRDLLDYLSTKVGLDMKALDVDVTKVTFSDGQAHASVSFHQKSDTSVSGGMEMQYTLAPKSGHWVVTGRADSQGRGLSGSANELPPGHPQVSGEPLPPGHPAIDPQQTSPSQGQPK